MTFKVEIEFESEEEFVLKWCQAIRARKIWRDGIEKPMDGKQNPQLILYGSTWMDCILDDLDRRLPQDLKPDGNETNKP